GPQGLGDAVPGRESSAADREEEAGGGGAQARGRGGGAVQSRRRAAGAIAGRGAAAVRETGDPRPPGGAEAERRSSTGRQGHAVGRPFQNAQVVELVDTPS